MKERRAAITVTRVGDMYELRRGNEVVCLCKANEIIQKTKELDNQMFEEEYKAAEEEGVPLCKYNSGVTCKSNRCAGCGWRYEVSRKRLKRRYGEKALQYLSSRKESETVNDGVTDNRV